MNRHWNFGERIALISAVICVLMMVLILANDIAELANWSEEKTLVFNNATAIAGLVLVFLMFPALVRPLEMGVSQIPSVESYSNHAALGAYLLAGLGLINAGVESNQPAYEIDTILVGVVLAALLLLKGVEPWLSAWATEYISDRGGTA